MSYIDTSVIVAALDSADPRRRRAREILEEEGHKVISELVLAELASALSRREELMSDLASRLGLSRELTIAAILLYIMRRFNLRYKALVSRAKTLPFGKMHAPTAAAVELSGALKLKTLDLLHAAYIKLLKNEGEPIHTLVTADSDFEKAKKLKSILGIDVTLIE